MGANICKSCDKLEQVSGVVDEVCRDIALTPEGYQDGHHGLYWIGRIVIEYSKKDKKFWVMTRFEK